MQNEHLPAIPQITMKNKYTKHPRHASNVTESLKTYGGDERLSYMDSAIDITQNDTVQFPVPQEKQVNLLCQELGESLKPYTMPAATRTLILDDFNKLRAKSNRMQNVIRNPWEWDNSPVFQQSWMKREQSMPLLK